jgi:ribosome-binding protein aMBF1 (putative translation factor)
MATARVPRRVEGSLVIYKKKLCTVLERNDSYGYNIYKITPLDELNLITAFPYELEVAEAEQAELLHEFNQDFDEDIPATNTRFSNISDKEKQDFVEKQKNINTSKKPKTSYNIFKKYLRYIGEEREAEDIAPQELNAILEKFFIVVRKENGDEYEPSSLRSIMGSIARHLTEKKYTANIMNATDFSGMREAVGA